MLVIGLTQKVGIASTWPGIICQQFGTVLPCLCNGPYPPSKNLLCGGLLDAWGRMHACAYIFVSYVFFCAASFMFYAINMLLFLCFSLRVLMFSFSDFILFLFPISYVFHMLLFFLFHKMPSSHSLQPESHS